MFVEDSAQVSAFGVTSLFQKGDMMKFRVCASVRLQSYLPRSLFMVGTLTSNQMHLEKKRNIHVITLCEGELILHSRFIKLS